MSTRYLAGIIRPGYAPLKVPSAPTIGNVTATGTTTVSVAFTAPSDVGGGAISSYTAYANCGVYTASNTISPVTVSGLTTATSYTFKVIATNAYGPSFPSSASSSVTTLSVPGAPTIGTAAVAGPTSASVPFTAPANNGGSTITTYTATSSPGNITGTLSQAGSGTITVSGLTTDTSYTFTVTATNAIGTSAASAASNSVTPFATCSTFTTAGTFTWVAPTGVTSIAAVAVGGGGHAAGRYKCGCYERPRGGGGGGALAYANGISVTPGTSYTVVVGSGGQTNCAAGGQSYFNTTATVRANGGSGGSVSTFTGGAGGTVGAGTGGSGGKGGDGSGNHSYAGAGGGGAGGYAGNGGTPLGSGSQSYGAEGGSGGAGGGGSQAATQACKGGGGGGGVGIFGQGTSGAGYTCGAAQGHGPGGVGGNGGSGGTNGTNGSQGSAGGLGGTYGGGSGSVLNSTTWQGNFGGGGAVRLVYCRCGVRGTPSFPSTNVGA